MLSHLGEAPGVPQVVFFQDLLDAHPGLAFNELQLQLHARVRCLCRSDPHELDLRWGASGAASHTASRQGIAWSCALAPQP